MEKELLEQRKNKILLCKKELEKNKNQKENLVSENDKLNIEYKEIVDSIINLKKEINEYEQTKRINKFSKILLIVSIVSVLGILGLAHLSPVAPAALSVTSNVVATITMTLFLGGIFSVPYVSTRNYIKNINIEEIKEALKLEEFKINQNIEKCETNEKEMKDLENKKSELEDEVYKITIALLRNEEERNVITSEVFENYPSYEFVEVFTDNMYEKSKIKLKK